MDYVSEVTRLLNEFDRILGELLKTEKYAPSEHRKTRERPAILLPSFGRKAGLVQKQLFGTGAPTESGSKLRKNNDDGAVYRYQRFSRRSFGSIQAEQELGFSWDRDGYEKD